MLVNTTEMYFVYVFQQLTVNEKSQNLRRLQAQRNELNAKGKTEEEREIYTY